MTITMAVAVPEGIVVGADSRMTYANARMWPKVASDFAYKLFEIPSHGLASTFGWAFLNNENINSLMKRFCSEHKTDVPIAELAEELRTYFQAELDRHLAAKLDAPPPPDQFVLGFLLAGYDPGGTEGQVFRILLPGSHCQPFCGTKAPGAVWEGQTDVISRLIKGVDPRLDRSKLPADVNSEIDKLEYVTSFNRLTLQDAIDYAIFLMRTTTNMQRFSDGIMAAPGDIAGTGGPIDLALVEASGVRWIQRKELVGELPNGAPPARSFGG